jgi:hypothetical protein
MCFYATILYGVDQCEDSQRPVSNLDTHHQKLSEISELSSSTALRIDTRRDMKAWLLGNNFITYQASTLPIVLLKVVPIVNT